jgi:hypothetical protein
MIAVSWWPDAEDPEPAPRPVPPRAHTVSCLQSRPSALPPVLRDQLVYYERDPAALAAMIERVREQKQR